MNKRKIKLKLEDKGKITMRNDKRSICYFFLTKKIKFLSEIKLRDYKCNFACIK